MSAVWNVYDMHFDAAIKNNNMENGMENTICVIGGANIDICGSSLEPLKNYIVPYPHNSYLMHCYQKGQNHSPHLICLD